MSGGRGRGGGSAEYLLIIDINSGIARIPFVVSGTFFFPAFNSCPPSGIFFFFSRALPIRCHLGEDNEYLRPRPRLSAPLALRLISRRLFPGFRLTDGSDGYPDVDLPPCPALPCPRLSLRSQLRRSCHEVATRWLLEPFSGGSGIFRRDNGNRDAEDGMRHDPEFAPKIPLFFFFFSGGMVGGKSGKSGTQNSLEKRDGGREKRKIWDII